MLAIWMALGGWVDIRICCRVLDLLFLAYACDLDGPRPHRILSALLADPTDMIDIIL